MNEKNTMPIKKIDLSTYPRREHFEHFLTMERPFLELTADVDITAWLQAVRARGCPFFLTFLYALAAAANSVPALRQRIRSGAIEEYGVCGASYTVALPDGTYRYAGVQTDLPFAEYLRRAEQTQKEAAEAEHLTETGDPESFFWVSNLPWLSYSQISLPAPDRCFSVPCFTMGKYRSEPRFVTRNGERTVEERVLLPVSVLVSHALADGFHLAQFYAALEKELRAFVEAGSFR